MHICPVSECPKDLLVVRSQDRFSGRYTYVEDKDLWKNLISGELMWKSAEGVYANLLLTSLGTNIKILNFEHFEH